MAANEDHAPAAAGEESDVRPWARLGAKLIDLGLFLIPFMILMFGVGLVIGIVLAGSPNTLEALISPGFWSGLIWTVLGIVVWSLTYPAVEALIISLSGTTPGKWLLGISVTRTDGGRLSFGRAYFRSFRAAAEGLALGIPLLQLIAMLMAFNKLNSEGSVSWDRMEGVAYQTGPVGVVRGTIGALLAVASWVGQVAINLLSR